MLKGSPRYVKGKLPLEQPKVLDSTSNLSSDTFIGTIIDLSKFTLRPVEREKLFSSALRKK
jgi:hypothetical protein